MNFFENIENKLRPSFQEIADALHEEFLFQSDYAKFIASENYNSLPVFMAMSAMTVDKYSEGIPGKRYYAGCEQVDKIERLAIEKAKELFGAEYANVQPCSGSDANLMAYYAIVRKLREKNGENYKPKLLSLDVSCGGHLTHSNKMNIVNELFDVYTYKVDIDGWLNYTDISNLTDEVCPDVILAGYSAYPRMFDFEKFREIADDYNSILMVDMAHFSAFCIKGGEYEGRFNPIKYADIITSTTQKTLRAGRGGLVLAKKEWAEYLDKGCPTMMGGPLNNMIAAKAVGFIEALKPEFKEYTHQMLINAKALAESLQENSIKLQTDGTDNHIVLLNLTSLGITGIQAEKALYDCHIVTNRNSIPNDKEKPLITSGLRLGVPALTTRGLKEDEMREFGNIIADVLKNINPMILPSGELSKQKYYLNDYFVIETKKRVFNILKKHPLYSGIWV